MQKTFIARLAELKGHLSVSAFARYLEIPQNTLDCYIKGRRKPSVDLLIRVCDKCGVSADWLLGRSPTTSITIAKTESTAPAPISSCEAPQRGPSQPPKPFPQINSQQDLAAEIAALKRRVNALESSTSMATCG